MNFARSLQVIARLIAATGLSLFVLPLTATAELAYEVVFTGNPAGYVTYDAVDDLLPSSFVFTSGRTTWDETDTITGSLDTWWVDGAPFAFGAAGITDDDTGSTLFMNLFSTYFLNGNSEVGSYSFEPTQVPSLSGIGIAILGTLMGIAGWRTLRVYPPH